MPDFIVVILILLIFLIFDHFSSKHPKPTSQTSTEAADLALYRYNKHQYLHSPEWKTKRQHLLKLAKYSCQMCGSQRNLHVHHISYTHLFQEPASDLAVVCSSCHNTLHAVHGIPQTLKDYEAFHGPLIPLY